MIQNYNIDILMNSNGPTFAALTEPEVIIEELDLDVILEDAFIRACKTTAKKTEFPILTSNFFRVHVVPACPPYCPTLDVKKTKWKKLSKFLAEKQTEGIITIKEPKKGVETITDINQDHPRILQFKVIKYEGLVQLPFFSKNLFIFRLTIPNLFYLFISLPELKCKFGELILNLAQSSHT